MSTKNEPEYRYFDFLRFVLAFVVLLDHLSVISWHQSGNLAVQTFFALSGWLIGSILLETNAAHLNRFYFKRVTRVWIPYFFTVVALYLASALFEGSRSTRWWEFLIYDVTFTHNWFTLSPDPKIAIEQMPFKGTGNGLWSISLEEQFYLVSPLIITLMPYGKSVGVWLAIAAWALISPGYYASICFGVLAAVLFNTRNWSPNSRTATLSFAAIFLLSALALWRFQEWYLYAAPFFAVATVLLCAQPGRRTAVSKWIGGVSFPLYLNAWIGLFAFHALEKKLRLPSVYSGRILLEIFFSFAGAVVTYHLIDRQVMKYRDRYYSATLGWLLGAVAYLLIIVGLAYSFWFR